MRIGLDPLAERLVGTPAEVELPVAGTRVARHGAGWCLRVRGHDLCFRTPVGGIVRTTGGPSDGFYLEIDPDAQDGGSPPHLLQGAEARIWMLREFERLQQLAASDGLGATLADGGTLPADFATTAAPLWRRLADELLLQT
jgi:hypothetical protein